MPEPAAVRKNLDVRDIAGTNVFLAAQCQHHGDGGMGAAAAWKLLESNALLLDLCRVPPIGQRFLHVEKARAVKDVEEALLMLIGKMIGFETSLGKQRRHQAVPAALADMQRLGHRSEIGLDAARKRCGDRERGCGPLWAEFQQIGSRGSSSDRA